MIVNRVHKLSADYKRICIQAPTGWGKTIVLIWMVIQALKKGHRIHIYIQSKGILSQLAKELADHGIDFGWLCAGMPESPEKMLHIGLPSSVIRKLDHLEKPTMVFEDECHHAPAATWQIIRAWLGDIRIFGFTATPKRTDRQPLGASYEILVQGPSNSELITAGILVPTRVYAPPIVAELSDLVRGDKDFTSKSLDKVFNNKKVIGDAVGHYLRLSKGSLVASFCCNVDHAYNTHKEYEAKGVPSAVLEGGMSDSQRENVFSQFERRKILHVASVNLMIEGVNFPALETVSMLRRTQSLIVFLQAIGRGKRSDKKNGKTHMKLLDHAGSVFLHGMPDMERQWDLTGDSGKLVTGQESKFKQCLKCHAFCPNHYSECYCGAPFGGKPRLYLVDKNGGLEEVGEKQEKVVVALAHINAERAAIWKKGGNQRLSDWTAAAERLGLSASWALGEYNRAKKKIRGRKNA